jgi:hypothetical protein
MERGRDAHNQQRDDETPPGALDEESVRERSELARHLRGSIFPADRAAVVACAIDEDAPVDLVDALRALPEDEVFLNVEGVWEALGGDREQRTHDDPHVEEPRFVPADLADEQAPRAGVPVQEFRFRFDLVHRLAAAPFLVSPSTASVVVDHAQGVLRARFGPWSVETSLQNVAFTRSTGPYHAVKTVGPPHVSLADRGLTFATNDQRGVCIQFDQPVRGIEPIGLLRHPAITVTVDDVDGVRAALARSHSAGGA